MPTEDPGAGNERTALAWQRTALALVAGAALLTRLTLDRLGWFAVVSVVVAGPLAGWVFVESRLRYAQAAAVRARPRPRGGRAPLALALATVVVATVELAALVAG
jgi:uncharacterized membrane protein YidH (DUF202 family)